MVDAVDALLERLTSSNGWMVRHGAFVELRRLDPAVVAEKASVIVPYTQDNFPWMRQLALEALAVLEPVNLAKHAPAIEKRLTDIDTNVCCCAIDTLSLLQPEHFRCYVDSIVRRIHDEEASVQICALKALENAEPAALVQHFEEIQSLRENDVEGVRNRANDICWRLAQHIASLPSAVFTLQAYGSARGTWVCRSMSGSVAEPVSSSTTCGEIRNMLAREQQISPKQVRLVLENATLITEDDNHVSLDDLRDMVKTS